MWKRVRIIWLLALIIGSYACQADSNGTYGTKVKKAIEYNEKGGNVQIMKETDFFVNMKWRLMFAYCVSKIEGWSNGQTSAIYAFAAFVASAISAFAFLILSASLPLYCSRVSA